MRHPPGETPAKDKYHVKRFEPGLKDAFDSRENLTPLGEVLWYGEVVQKIRAEWE